MVTETQRSIPQTTVRISGETKKRIQTVARRLADREDRRVSEIDVADKILGDGLSKIERKLGIKKSDQ